MTQTHILEAIQAAVEKRKNGIYDFQSSSPASQEHLSSNLLEVMPQMEYALTELARAQVYSVHKSRGIFKMFRFFMLLRKQKRVNRALIRCLESSLHASQKLILLLHEQQEMDSQHSAQHHAWQEANERSLAQLQDFVRTAEENAKPSENPHQHDAFYLLLENQFRGDPEVIRSRLAVYLPYIEAAWNRLAKSNPALLRETFPSIDIGCGRGEWLELLRDHDFPASRGIDLNRSMVKMCQQKQLTVSMADGIEELRALPDQSVGLISGFHIIEHLPFEQLMELLKQTHRVLLPGGLAIFETPNPETLRVGSFTFHYDPTHLKPIPPALLELMSRHSGFSETEILRLHPYSDFDSTADLPNLPELNRTLNGPLDYAGILTR